MIAPLLVWGAHLLFVYIVLAVSCATRPASAEALLPVLVLASVGACAALGAVAAMQYRRLRQDGDDTADSPWGERSLLLKTGLLTNVIALVAVLWTTLPLVFIAPCA